MKILMWADGGCNTGFGTVTHNLATRWLAAAHDVHVLAINYRGDPWEGGYKLYTPTRNNPGDILGLTRLAELISSIEPDILFILNDLNIVAEGLRVLGGAFPVSTVLYTPIDGTSLPKEWLIPAANVDVLVAMSKFGQRVFKDEANLRAEMIWHGVEHESFYPIAERPLSYVDGPAQTKQELKRLFGVEDRFVVLAVNRNSMRKNYPDTFRVFAEFHKRHPDSFLIVHAVRKDEGGDLGTLIDRFHLHEAVRLSDPRDTFIGSPKEVIAGFYNLADVKLSLSLGEGFGLTDAEALACGTPVVAQRCSATEEVVGPGGILVAPERVFTTARMVDFQLPNVGAFVRALEKLYKDAALREHLGRVAAQHAKQFSWDAAASEFLRLMDGAIAQRKAG